VIEKKRINFFLLQTCNEVHLGRVGGGARRCRGVTRVMDGVLRWNIGMKSPILVEMTNIEMTNVASIYSTSKDV